MKIFFLLLVTCLVHLQLCAQSSDNFSSAISVQAVMELSLTTSSSNLIFSTPDQYSAEYVLTSFNTVKIKSNQGWNLSIASTSSVFSASGTFASSNMPASLCKIGVTGQSSTLSLSTTSQLLSTGTRGSDASTGNTFDITLKVNPGYTYGAGIYNLGIVYTLTAK